MNTTCKHRIQHYYTWKLYQHTFHSWPLQDGNGYIDEHELDALLRDLYQKHKMVICCWMGIQHSFWLLWILIESCACVFVFRSLTLKVWPARRRASWRCLMEGSCFGPNQRLCYAKTHHSELFHFVYCTVTHPKLVEVHVVALNHFLSFQSKSASTTYPSLCGMPFPEIWLLDHVCISCSSF